MHSLQQVNVADIRKNDDNPRLHFTEEELAKLAESISQKGVLVPVVVYEESAGSYVLIDGERRFICAQRLGLAQIPAVVADELDQTELLLQMFNIHLVRQPWADMPTAWALKKLIDETGVEDDSALRDMTGLSIDQVRRLRHALDLPVEYQEHIDSGKIPLNFFWELKKQVVDPLARHRPTLWSEFADDEVLKAFVDKRLAGSLTDVISLRKVTPIIKVAEEDAGSPESPSPLDEEIKRLIEGTDVTIDETYEATVEVMIEADRLAQRSKNIVRSFERLLDKAQSPDDREAVVAIASELADSLKLLIAQ